MPQGSTTALVGPTGAGKSTIANLLLRYYDVDEGSITIGGTPIQDICLKYLELILAMYLKIHFFLTHPCAKNLLLGAKSALVKELNNALHHSHAKDFVNALPHGIDTLIGERGVRLSMGEKQRLTLARAMLKSSPILILDEATASVDVETERQIQHALNHLTKKPNHFDNCTPPEYYKEADTIIFLENGSILEQGCHNFLLDKNGAYANFCNLQENLVRQ